MSYFLLVYSITQGIIYGSFSRRIYITACLLGSVGWHVAEEIAMSVSARPLPSAAEDVRIHFKEFADLQITIPLL